MLGKLQGRIRETYRREWATLFLRRNAGQHVKSTQIGKCSVAKMLIASGTPQIGVTLWFSFQSGTMDLL
jgi:hypothetical protein